MHKEKQAAISSRNENLEKIRKTGMDLFQDQPDCKASVEQLLQKLDQLDKETMQVC